MKTTGVIRRIDELGRIVIPKEIRKNLRIKNGDSLEIFLESDNIILKKYSPIGELGQMAESFAETASSVLGLPVLVSDTDRFVAASGIRQKDYIDREIDADLDEIIQCKEKLETASRIVIPILTNGDPIGSVTVLPTESHALTEAEIKTAELGAKLLARQMEQ